MPTQVRLFISAGPEEEPAREVLGRALAELPITVGWKIKRTPDVDSVAECHLFALVLGRDIVAPVGLELWWALRTEKSVIAYRAAVPRTPAGQVFVQENAFLTWTDYATLPALRRAFLKDIGRFLLAHPDRYGVSLLEAETLRSFLARLDESAPAPAPPKAEGAAGGGVILAPGKDTPRGARIIEG